MLCLGGGLFGCSYIRYVAIWHPKTEISFESQGLKLSGTLIKPRGSGPFPAVVILHGPGPQQTHGMSGIAYRMHANAFVKKGFVALIYDKRGSGKSEGSFRYLDYPGFMADAGAAIDFLKSLPEVSADRIGIATNSESGFFVPELSRKRGDIKFIYNRVGPVVPFSEVAVYQQRLRLQKAGLEPEEIDRILRLMQEIFDFTIASAREGQAYYDKNRRELQRKVDQAVKTYGAKMLPFGSKIMSYNHEKLTRIAYTYNYDPKVYLTDCQVPMFFVYGAEDELVPTGKCLEFLDQLKHLRGNIKCRVYKRDNHTLNRFPYIFFHGYYPPGYFMEMTDWAYRVVNDKI